MGNRIRVIDGVHIEEEVRGYCKPLLSSLTRQLRNPHILNHVANPSFSMDGILRDDGDGTNTREHPIFQLYPDCLRIRLYYDDVQVTNGLGSYQTKIGECKRIKLEYHSIPLFFFANFEEMKM